MNTKQTHNELAWDKKADENIRWTVPVSTTIVNKAKKGEFSLSLGGNPPMPRDWLPEKLEGLRVLCLASGGGQQGPIFAALGCDVTVLDISQKQLERDIMVGHRDKLQIKTVKSDMANLSMFEDNYFDVIFCPVSLTYVEDTLPVFRECYRVLRVGGSFLLGFTNPHIYIFDGNAYDKGVYVASNKLPYNSFDEMDKDEAKEFIAAKKAVEYSHTVKDLIGNQLDCGFAITGFFESGDSDGIKDFFSKYYNTKAVKL